MAAIAIQYEINNCMKTKANAVHLLPETMQEASGPAALRTAPQRSADWSVKLKSRLEKCIFD